MVQYFYGQNASPKVNETEMIFTKIKRCMETLCRDVRELGNGLASVRGFLKSFYIFHVL